MVSWPSQIKAGQKSDALVQNLDFAQTFLDAADIPAPKDMQGQSLIPLMTGKSWKRDAVYYHYYEYPAEHMVNRHYAIVTKKYKLIHYYFSTDAWELIDREKDPLELKNVYNDPAYASIRKTLHKQLDALRLKYKDNSTISNGYIDRFLNDAAEGKVFGVPKQKAAEMKAKRK